MKKLSILILLISGLSGFAQDLSTKIPKEALVVATIKGENLTELMSIDDINKSYVGREILKEFSRKQEQPFSSLEDMGLDFEASSHYFYQANDSIHYNVVLMPIKDVSKFEDMVSTENRTEVISKYGFRTYEEKSASSPVVFWNSAMVVFVMGDVSDSYFDAPEVMERYGLQEIPEYNYGYYDDVEVYGQEPIMDAGEDLDDAYEVVEEAADAIEETVMESTEALPEKTEEIIEEKRPIVAAPPPPPAPPVGVEESVEIVEDANYDEHVYDVDPYEDSYNDAYNNAYNTNYDIKKRLQKEWSTAHALKILSQPADQSIISNKVYLASLDKNAEATLWVGDFSTIYEGLFGGSYYQELLDFNIGSMYADSGMSAKLYAEKDEMRLTTSYTMSESMAKSYKKMTKQKLNRKFLNYINEDRMIGYMSYAINTEAALLEYPKILKSIYASMPKYGDEAALAVDFVQLLLDEAAVAKVFPGDMLFLLSGISKKEVTYKSYEYNDNYEYEEIEKTKTETVPDFLMMVSSEDQRLLKKLVDYGMKKEVVQPKNGYYAMEIPESPLGVFMAFKDDIIFFGTSETEINQIVRGNFDAKIASKHKKLLKNSNYSVYMSGKQLASKIPMDELGVKDMKKLNWFLQNSEDAYMSSSNMRGNTIEADMVIGVPASQENAMTYIFNMIETFSR